MKTYKLALPALAVMMMLSPAFYQESQASLKVGITRAPAQAEPTVVADSTYVKVDVALTQEEKEPTEDERERVKIEPLELKPIGIQPLKIDPPKLELIEIPSLTQVDLTSEEEEEIITLTEDSEDVEVIASDENSDEEEVVASDENSDEEEIVASDESTEEEEIVASDESSEEEVVASDESSDEEEIVASDESSEEEVVASDESSDEEEIVASDESSEEEIVASSNSSFEELTGLVCKQQNQIDRMTASIDTLVQNMNAQMQLMQTMTQLMMMQQLANSFTPTYQPAASNPMIDGFQAFMYGQRMGSLMNIFSPIPSLNFGANSQTPAAPVYNYNITGDFYGRDYNTFPNVHALPQAMNGMMGPTSSINWMDNSNRIAPFNSPTAFRSDKKSLP